MKRWLRRLAVLAVVVFVAMQVVPYGWPHSNPPVRADARWPDEKVASIARTSCYACHSNETDWPAYSYIAPASWLVRHDVESGRDELNFSVWDDDSDADDAAEAVAEGSMPPSRYTLLHPDARLTDAERRRLIAALGAMERRDDRDNEDRDEGNRDDRRDEDDDRE